VTNVDLSLTVPHRLLPILVRTLPRSQFQHPAQKHRLPISASLPLIRRALHYTPAPAHSLCTHGWSADSEGESAEPPNMPLTFACTQAPCRRPPYLVCYFFFSSLFSSTFCRQWQQGAPPFAGSLARPGSAAPPPHSHALPFMPLGADRACVVHPCWCAPSCAPSSLMPP
jgi:hypothetical protein